ncbi:MAG TPA: two-component regulator propeller domain-containing protein [Bacteroidia bacterium]|jgi:hypothetical protein|nr:two-component regulator propeller domain-containing protein [Bacteroidia bacterium]
MKKFFLIAFFFQFINSYAQELYFENSGLKLPSTEVYQIFQDSHGFIWLCTDAGICKYDGNTITTYTVKDGISENVVINIKEDSKKRIWFNTVSGNFFYYEHDHFTKIDANNRLSKIAKPYHVNHFAFGEKDTIYASANSPQGLLKIPPQHNYREILHQYGFFNSPATLRYVLRNKANELDPITGGGLECMRNDSTYHLFLFDTLISISLKGMKGYYYGDLIDLKASQDGMVYLNNRNILIKIKKGGKSIQYYYFQSDILKIEIDNDGDLWIGTRTNGGYLFKDGNIESSPVRFLTNLSVTSVCIDKEGSVWASTLEKGIFQCMNRHVYTIFGKTTDFELYEDELHISLFPKQKITVTPSGSLQFINDMPLLPKHTSILCFLKQKKGTYYSTRDNFFYIKGNSVLTILDQYKHPLLPKQIIELDNDTILCITTGSLYFFHNQKFIKNFNYLVSATCGTRLSDKRILIGSRNNEGIYEFKNDRFIPFLNQFKALHTRINQIMEDPKGNLWIATNEKGIFCYDKNHQLHHLTEKNGLLSNKVNSFVRDNNGDIWCGTYSGLSRLIISENLNAIKIENLDSNHGVTDPEIEKVTNFQNKIWCGGKTALFYFDPKDMKKNTCPPYIYIKGLKIKNENYRISDTLHLNYDQANFRLQYDLISFKKSPEKLFLYKLAGYDKDWNTTHTNDFQYTNIPYGTYTIIVYGVNNDGLPSLHPIRLTLIIDKPFWLSWWFITFLMLLVIAAGYFIAIYWKHRIEKKERDKAAIQQELSEFKMTALRSQMNPHFIFNAIGSIQHYILENNKKESNYYLSKFAHLIRNILSNSSQEFITLEQEIATLKLYIELEQIRFVPAFEFILKIDNRLDMDMHIPTMLIQPYVENSIWHGLTHKESERVLELIFEKKGDFLNVIIRDNGVGRRKKKEGGTHVSKGMSITEQRIRILENTSTKKFETVIKDLTDEYNQPIGTEVNLIIPLDL